MFTEEDYVSLETGKLLKEKGFDEPCERFYCEMYDSIQDTFSLRFRNVSYKELEGGDILIPTLYEAQKWLMEELGLCMVVSPHVYVDEYDDEGYPCSTDMYWEVSIYSLSDGFQKKLDRCYDIYEDAFNKGIQEALKLN